MQGVRFDGEYIARVCVVHKLTLFTVRIQFNNVNDGETSAEILAGTLTSLKDGPGHRVETPMPVCCAGSDAVHVLER